jgi:hypothetical protein
VAGAATGVIIGVDPHKGSHTAVALDGQENVLGAAAMRAAPGQVDQLRRWAAPWPKRTWAIEGARGLGHLLTQQLVGAGESVVDVQHPSWPRGFDCWAPGRSTRTTRMTPARSPWRRCVPPHRLRWRSRAILRC